MTQQEVLDYFNKRVKYKPSWNFYATPRDSYTVNVQIHYAEVDARDENFSIRQSIEHFIKQKGKINWFHLVCPTLLIEVNCGVHWSPSWTELDLKYQAENMIHTIESHEKDEFFKIDGVHVKTPHPIQQF